MTITNVNYYDEIIGRLEMENIDIRHFILIEPKENIIKRLKNRENSTKWTHNQIDRCINTFNTECFISEKINTDDISIDEVTSRIIKLFNY